MTALTWAVIGVLAFILAGIVLALLALDAIPSTDFDPKHLQGEDK